jgi:hypothetical protein
MTLMEKFDLLEQRRRGNRASTDRKAGHGHLNNKLVSPRRQQGKGSPNVHGQHALSDNEGDGEGVCLTTVRDPPMARAPNGSPRSKAVPPLNIRGDEARGHGKQYGSPVMQVQREKSWEGKGLEAVWPGEKERPIQTVCTVLADRNTPSDHVAAVRTQEETRGEPLEFTCASYRDVQHDFGFDMCPGGCACMRL